MKGLVLKKSAGLNAHEQERLKEKERREAKARWLEEREKTERAERQQILKRQQQNEEARQRAEQKEAETEERRRRQREMELDRKRKELVRRRREEQMAKEAEQAAVDAQIEREAARREQQSAERYAQWQEEKARQVRRKKDEVSAAQQAEHQRNMALLRTMKNEMQVSKQRVASSAAVAAVHCVCVRACVRAGVRAGGRRKAEPEEGGRGSLHLVAISSKDARRASLLTWLTSEIPTCLPICLPALGSFVPICLPALGSFAFPTHPLRRLYVLELLTEAASRGRTGPLRGREEGEEEEAQGPADVRDGPDRDSRRRGKHGGRRRRQAASGQRGCAFPGPPPARPGH